MRPFGSTNTDFDANTRNFLIASGFMGLANGSFDAVFNFYLENQGLDKVAIGQIYSISMIGMGIAVVLQGFASRRYGLRPVHRLASWQFALTLFLIPLCHSVTVTSIVLSFVSGGFIGMLSTGAAIFGNRVGVERRVTLFSLFFASYLVCTMLGSVFAAGLNWLLPTSPEQNYVLVLLLSGGLGLVMCGFREASLRMGEPEEVKSVRIQGMKPHDRLPLLMLFISSFFLGGSILLVFRFSNLILTSDYGLSVSTSAVVLGAEKIFALMGALLAPTFKRMATHRALILVITAITALALATQATLPAIAIFLVVYFVRITMNYTLMPILDAVTISAFTKEQSILSTTSRQLAFYIGGAAAAIAYGLLLQAGQSSVAIALSGVMATLGGLILLMVREHEPTLAAELTRQRSEQAAAKAA
jgi:predicted MFS family arabinose efflux permease